MAGKKIENLTEKLTLHDDDRLVVADSEDLDLQGDFISKNIKASLVKTNIEVEDEGSSIETALKTINFVGADVEVRRTANGEVVVYCPPPAFSPFFNTSGSTIVNNIYTSSRHVSNPTSEGVPFAIGGWVPGTSYSVINNSTINYASINFSCDTNSTTFDAIIKNASGVALHTVTVTIDGTKTSSANGITINVNSFSVQHYKYISSISVSFDLSMVFPSSGRFSIELIHHNNGSDYTFTQNNIFYDAMNNTSTIGSVTMVDNTPVIKYISGVQGYDAGSSFTVTVNGLDYVNSCSYPTEILTINQTQYNLSNISNIQGVDLTGWNNYWDNAGASYVKSDWSVLGNNIYIKTTNASVTANLYDWGLVDSNTSPNNSIIINTLTSTSNRVVESFVDEDNRLLHDFTSPWDSTQSLMSYDAGNGLQVENGSLVYPVENYTIYNPNPSGQYDYSSASGDRYYYRTMWHNGISHSNGLFGIFGISESQLLNGDFTLEISLNKTDWFDCSKDYLGGALSDGDGCRINVGTYSLSNNRLEFTLGEGGYTSDTTGVVGSQGWGIFIRIGYTVNTVNCSRIEIVNW